MTRVKICGIRTFDDALLAAEAGADMLGLNFYRKSPRYVEPEKAQTICDALRAKLGDQCPVLVGVFVNATDGEVAIITNKVGLDFAQLSGDESADMMRELKGIAYKAVQPMNEVMALEDVSYFRSVFPHDERAPSLLVDAHHPTLRGGTGTAVSLAIALAVRAAVPRMMLAGGLTAENVAMSIRTIEPWGVDVASGVESGTPGVKDAAKVKAFIAAAKGVPA